MTDVPSEQIQAKAAELLLKGCVKVQHMVDGHFNADVTPLDGGDPYKVRFNAAGWHCDCIARVQVCKHVLACQTITDLTMDPVAGAKFAHDKSIDDLLGM